MGRALRVTAGDAVYHEEKKGKGNDSGVVRGRDVGFGIEARVSPNR